METLKKHWVRISLGLAVLVVLLLHAAQLLVIQPLNKLDDIIYDYRLLLTMPNTQEKRIVILDIDEKSLKEREKGGEGRWPWPRDRLALMVDKLFKKYGIAVIGFDVVFAERDESSGLKVLEQLGKNHFKDVPQYREALEKVRPQLEYDRLFAEKIKGRPVILGYLFSTSEGVAKATVIGALPEPVLPPGTFAGKPVAFTSWEGYTANLPELMEIAASAGHFNPLPDDDGVTRRVPMLAEYKGAYYESLSMGVVRAFLKVTGYSKDMPKVVPGYASDTPTKGYSGLEWLELAADRGSLRIPVDKNVTALIPYRGRQGSFKYIPAVDVLNDTANPADLKDKIVLLGTTAPGLFDLRSTPVGAVYPGVEVHANLIAGILDGNIKQKPKYVLGAEVMLLLLSGLALALLMPMLSPLNSSIVTAIILLGVLVTNIAVWHYGHLWLPLASGVVLIIGIFILNMSYGFFVEARSKRQITGLFGRYVSPELVDELSKHPEQVSMEGDSREMSVLFSDVRSFTTISEGLDPKELSKLMNAFLTALTDVIYKHRGTVDKYMGDCIMAFWGAPLTDSEHARNAVLAGLEMQAKLKALQPQFKENGWPEIKIGVGVNSGRMSVGNMGSQNRIAYTVMGDAVNLASRMEGITKEYGVEMIVGEGTKNTVTDFAYRELDRVRVKGKDEPVAIYEPIGPAAELDKAVQDELKLFQQTLKFYRAQGWDKTEMQLLNLQRMSQHKLYELYAERVQYFRANPPGSDWDGVFVFTHK